MPVAFSKRRNEFQRQRAEPEKGGFFNRKEMSALIGRLASCRDRPWVTVMKKVIFQRSDQLPAVIEVRASRE